MDFLAQYVGGDGNNPREDSGDSPIDRLNSRHTVSLLFLFSVIITFKQDYVGEQIHCFHPAHFEESHEKYSDALCFVNNTYVLPFADKVPKENEEKRYIGYYQWTSLILSLQAILFYLPRGFWLTFNKKSGIDVITMTGASVDCLLSPNPESQEKIIKYMVKHMSRFLTEVNGKINLSIGLKGIFWRLYGSYLTFSYIIVKLLYVINSVVQLMVLDLLLGLRNELHGLNFFWHLLIDDDDDIVSPLFPRVAFCDFHVRYLGNIHRYTIQCSLPINLFNEKIFIAVWFWLVFVSIASIGSAFIWIWYCFYFPRHTSYIRTALLTTGEWIDKPTLPRVHQFVNNYLRRDGILLIYLIACDSSKLIAAEVVLGLWTNYWKEIESKITFNPKILVKTIPPSIEEDFIMIKSELKKDSLFENHSNCVDVVDHWRRLSLSKCISNEV